MTIKETLEKHRELWTRIAERLEVLETCGDFCIEFNTGELDIDEAKADTFEELEYDHSEYKFDCFCCTYADQFVDHTTTKANMKPKIYRCPHCILDWGKKDGEYIPCFEGLYEVVEKAINNEEFAEAADAAYAIANLPLKKGIE